MAREKRQSGMFDTVQQQKYFLFMGEDIMFQKVITITLNPSLDATLWVNRFDLSEPVIATREVTYPGGKAINVSRVLTSLGVENKAIGIVGEDNAHKFMNLLDEENISYDFIEISGSIRENLSIVLPDGNLFKINRSGFSVGENTMDALNRLIEKEIDGFDSALLIFAGSLPKNISSHQYKELIMRFRSEKTKVCIDTDVLSGKDIMEIKPYVIKPNHIELSHIAGKKLESFDEIKEYAVELSKHVEHVLVSMGADGLLYAGNGCVFNCNAPKVQVKSTIGAGDTTLAAFITALLGRKDISQCVTYATACGTASVLLEGTGIITKAEAEMMFETIKSQ